MRPKIVLKEGREKSIRQRHPLIFSGAIARFPEFEAGDILSIHSARGEYLGCGYFQRDVSLAGRVLWFSETPENCSVSDWSLDAFRKATRLRQALRIDSNGMRLISGESDGFPGLTVDLYADVAVIQISSFGLEKIKSQLVESLFSVLQESKISCSGILQKPVPPGSSEKGTLKSAEWLHGEARDSVIIHENSLKFKVSLSSAQKTGFFLDQRENRALARRYSAGRRVLNCFSYSGGFSVYAAAGAAKSTISVDSSQDAVALAQENLQLNGIDLKNHTTVKADVFEYLREEDFDSDLIVLDPPAFARTQKDIPNAMKGYRDIHRLAFERILPGGFVMTTSCSHPIDESTFKKVIFQAALEARRDVKILGRHLQAPDHPLSVYYPEGEYIKGFFLYVE